MSADSRPLVSVVTPVYNGEAFLRECIESVLSQTYSHWDYTIVDNCSTDRTLEIAREYAARDPRIRIHRNEKHVRVIENHNIAFRRISPESTYCKVIAADDRLRPACLEKMVRLAEENPSVAIVGAYGLAGSEVVWSGLPHLAAVVKGSEVCRMRLLGGAYVFGTPTSVLYRSDIVRSRPSFYNESNLHSDEEVCLEFLQRHDFGFVHEVLTEQGVRKDSLTSYSSRFQTYLPWRLYKLVHYGPAFLGAEELARQTEAEMKRYYHYLGEQLFKRRGRSFWDFHRGKLREAGHPMSAMRVGLASLSFLAGLVLHPGRSIEKLQRHVRLRRAARLN